MSKFASNLSHVSSASEIGVGVRCVDGYFDILFYLFYGGGFGNCLSFRLKLCGVPQPFSPNG